uniref:Si:dkey-159a18.1 n=1 Tax=Cyclopterus lumpus TaxID=8103 RepID=A0A8C2Z5J8_CYCLU
MFTAPHHVTGRPGAVNIQCSDRFFHRRRLLATLSKVSEYLMHRRKQREREREQNSPGVELKTGGDKTCSFLSSLISTDYAKSFHDISHRINNTFIREEFGVSVGPGSSVILTADVPVLDNRGGIVFTSTDAGATFKFIQLPFHLAQPITYHFLNPGYLVALSIDGGLWLSLDFGAQWTKVHDGVLASSLPAVEAEERGDLVLKRTTDLGTSFTTIHEDIYSFGYIGAFLFFSVMEDSRSPRVMYFSSDQGDTFSRALLPSASTEQFYSILDGDEDMLFMHVDNPGDTFFGTMYTSDDRGILFSKSLERHLFDGQRKSDFTNITSLRGVYLTNKLDEDGRIRSVISFNRGGTWRHLNKPENVDCGEQVKHCNIHIHGEHSRNIRIVPMLALSEPTAIGLVIAHGTVGDSLSSSQHPDVFVSSDGGYNWRGTLRGPHHYSILDSGGLIVAVEAQREGQVKTIKFSTDEGQCWKSYNFTEQPFFFAGLASEPGTKAMNVSVWGFRPEEDGQPMWVAVTIDFQSLITRECNEEDYEEWLAHATGGGDLTRNGCLLGVKETYRRLKKPSVCRNGRGFVVSKKQSPCLCTREDYLCDYGYDRRVNTSECVRQHSAANKTLELCLNGEEDELLTAGYRKVPSDRCEGGIYEYNSCCVCFSQRERLVLILVSTHTSVLHAELFTRPAVADHSGFMSSSTGRQCIVSPTSGFRMKITAPRPILKAPPAAMARPACRNQMM